jgi:hypothetical protein
MRTEPNHYSYIDSIGILNNYLAEVVFEINDAYDITTPRAL